jgi:hypothetical protein
MGCRRHASGRCGAGAAPVADGGHRLLLGEPGASGGHLAEAAGPLKDVAKAHRIVETGHSAGKVILIP